MFLDALGAGSFGSPLASAKGPKMLAGDHQPAFTIDLVLKDLGLARELARSTGVATASLDGLAALFQRARAAGLGGRDLSAVIEALGVPPPAAAPTKDGA